MSLSERHRATLYQGLVAAIEDEEAVAEMLAHFPSRPGDELITESRLQLTESRIDARFGQVDARFDRVDARFDLMESRYRAELHDGLSGLRVEMHTEVQRVLRWLVTSQLAVVSTLLTVIALTR